MSQISDIANGIELGENRTDTYRCYEAMYPGNTVMKVDADNVALSDGGSGMGIAGHRYNHDLDTIYATGTAIPVVTRGYVAALFTAPALDHLKGELTYSSAVGTQTFIAGGEPFGELMRDMDAGDCAGIIKILRGT